MTCGGAGCGFGPVLRYRCCSRLGGSRLASLGPYRSVECAPYARARSGLSLRGAAHAWWREAAGRYQRGQVPIPGSVLVFRRSARLPYGHGSVVRRVVSGREIRVDQANWAHHRLGRDDPVMDVSRANDWSKARVWWAPSGALGRSAYATYGFVGPGPAGADVIASATR